METKTKWHSCRLVANSETGRVKWCIGQEKKWQNRMKYLVLLPAILLPITLLCVLLTCNLTRKNEVHTKKLEPLNATETFDELSLLQTSETSFVPEITEENSHALSRNRRWQKKPVYKSVIKTLKQQNNSICDDLKNIDKKLYNNVNITFLCKDNKWAGLNLKEIKEDILRKSKLKQKYGTEYKRAKRFNDKENDMLDNIYREVDDFLISNDEDDELIKTKIRTLQANKMNEFMNTSVNPCEDFYLYACGNWEKYNPIPAEKSVFDTFEVLRERLDKILRNLLHDVNEDYENKKETFSVDSLKQDAILKAKIFYKSCIDIKVLENRGYQPLMDLLQTFGGWPMLDPNWNESEFNWLELTAKLRLYNNNILITQWVGPDMRNSQKCVIQLDQTTLGLPSRDYFTEPDNAHYLDAYKTFITSAVKLLGKGDAADEVNEMIVFETKLAEITAPPAERRNITDVYLRLTIRELNKELPAVDWSYYFKVIFDHDVDDEQEIVCYSIEYLHDLLKLIQKTPARTVANYLLWRFVKHRLNNLDDSFMEANDKFSSVIHGRKKSPPRWQHCIAQINANMGMAVGNLFVQKYFDEFSKNDTMQMTIEIQKSFFELLTDIDWLAPDTKKLAREKVDSMKLKIGYPDFILNQEKLAKLYEDVDIRPDRYFENVLNILQHITRVSQARLNQRIDSTHWSTAPAVINAYYSRNKNQIIFPAGILQPPFYHRHFPRALNFGGIGIVVGHEITHGFDDKGRLFDSHGNINRWWNDVDIHEFNSRAQCLIEQYNNYTIFEIDVKVDGLNTHSENIADNGGIKQSYLAYQKWLKNNPAADESLPGLNVTGSQLFFLNFAQVWCGAMRPEATRNKIKTAVHSPGRYRVIGTLSNYPEFAQVFHCPTGSGMNPSKKCNVW